MEDRIALVGDAYLDVLTNFITKSTYVNFAVIEEIEESKSVKKSKEIKVRVLQRIIVYLLPSVIFCIL